MGYVIRMPQMGMEMDEGEVVEWAVEEGEAVDEDEVVAVVESEKATNEVEAREAGTLRRIVVPEGGTVEPGTPVGILAGPDEDLSEYEAEIEEADAADDGGSAASAGASDDGASSAAGGGGSGAAVAAASTGDGQRASGQGTSASERDTGDTEDVRATPGAQQFASEEGIDLAAVAGTGPQGVVTEDDVENHAAEVAAESDGAAGGGASTDGQAGEVRATPGARRLAGEEGVDLAGVEGTGPQGVVIEDDVEDYLTEATPDAAAAADSGAATRTVSEARQLSGVQQTISDRLGESYRNAVHVTVKREFDATALRNVSAAADAAGADVSMTDLLVRAAGAELAARPAFNALFEDGEHRPIEEVNIGVAVDVEAGLITPVVPRVDAKSVETVADARGRLTDRALSGEFTSDDLAGGTFTITNLGPFGVDSFDPVINPPEVAILGVGRVRNDGAMTLSLSFDHRVLNGADAAKFLDGLVGTLTDALALAAFFETDLLADESVEVSVSPSE
jgi:pyruvate dehydrogenase E2 component (dihydrolipoamide acetyltransferase)